MDDAKLRAELESLAIRATQLHELSAITESEGNKKPSIMCKGEARGILQAIAVIGKLFDPPLEVVSEGPRYVVREKKRKDAAAFYEDMQRTEMGL